ASRSEADRIRLRMRVNFVISAFIVLLILIFRAINDVSVVHLVYTIAGYTYGPLLGLFVFGLFTRWQVRDRWVPLVCVVSSGLSYGINAYSLPAWGIDLGYTVLLVNALITFGGLWTIRK
ncbi:MAG: sodium:solute symporter, partial [Cyclobacteriaceae bacterium]|nr:sodium:solute symporter [Cyclobacteriaceae bacterium]